MVRLFAVAMAIKKPWLVPDLGSLVGVWEQGAKVKN
jgi:hypothetical protein